MILKLKIKLKKYKGYYLIAWIQREKVTKPDLEQIIKFFKDQIQVSKIWKVHSYYRVTSENPAIIISLFSTLQELIPEIYFDEEKILSIDKALDSQ
jgi:hypothetical protein